MEAELTDEQLQAMGFPTGFGTTKGKHVQGNIDGGADVVKQRKFRQYMNKRGGFNRSADPSA